jgi:hypothetical protein
MRPVCASVLLLSLASTAVAQDFQVGARAKGMGGSYTAFDEDPVAIWLNPAGIAGAPSRIAIDYQTFSQYELDDPGAALGTQGDATTGLLDPPIVPSFIGFVSPVTKSDEVEHAFGAAMVRPFQNRLTYLNGALRVQTEQQFSRFRFAWAAKWRAEEDEHGAKTFAAGVGLDLGFSAYRENDDAGLLDRSETDTHFGFGLGMLLSVINFDDTMSVDIGVAYQSRIDFAFQIDPELFPVWDWPAMVNAGVTIKCMDKFDLRLTFDVQYIFWDQATKNDTTGAGEDFQDAINLSIGVEYYVRVAENVAVLPRAGYRRYDAPWSDPNRLPAIGNNVLSIDTRDEAFDILTLGVGVQWVTNGKVRSVDAGLEAGGDAPNFSVGYRHDF